MFLMTIVGIFACAKAADFVAVESGHERYRNVAAVAAWILAYLYAFGL